MAGFITDYLPDFPGDWECIEDFCGSWTAFGYHDTLNVCAWFSPSRRLVMFGGDWYGTPDMPAEVAPTEEACWDWARNADTIWARRLAAAQRRTAAREAQSVATTAHYEVHGYNWIRCAFRRPDGSLREFDQCCGRIPWQQVLQAASGLMLRTEPVGTRLTRFRFETGLTEGEVEYRRTGKRPKKARKPSKTVAMPSSTSERVAA